MTGTEQEHEPSGAPETGRAERPRPAERLARATASPTIPLGALLHEYQLGLVLIAGAAEDPGSRPVQWVHVSELGDPTPFLAPRTVLLTTGARFEEAPDQAEADAFVARLIEAGVTALGVAIGLHWDRVPPRFVSACDRLGLPLFRVPYDTAFIEIVQTAARLLDAEERARDLWALESQRAVTNASLHHDGLAAAVREAAARLGRWVCITDRTGRVLESGQGSGSAPVSVDWLRRETRRMIGRGASAGRVQDERGIGIRLQTLGRQGAVLGVLGVEDAGSPDTAERTLLGLVAALATVQLEHRSGIDEAQAALRSGIVRLLAAGNAPLAEQLASGTLVRIPLGPVVTVRYEDGAAGDHGFEQDLRSLDAGSPGLFAATLDGAPLIVSETRHLPAIRRLFQAHGVPAGISDRGPLDTLDELLAQSERALEHAAAASEPGPIDYRPTLHDGVLRILDGDPEAHRRAAMLLAPIRHHDDRHGDRIEESLAVWLGHHGQTSPAAAELGIHRHTLKSRVQTAGALLQADLDSPGTRAELWTALRLAGGQAAGSAGSGGAGTGTGTVQSPGQRTT